MKTLFKSQYLWDYAEIGFASSNEDEARTNEHHKKDTKALFYIQQAMDESIFLRIASATITKQAWMILSAEYQGSSKVIIVKLQSLRLEFETSSMKSNESVQDLLARVSTMQIEESKVEKWHFKLRESMIIQVNVEEEESKYAQEEDKEDNFLFMTISTKKKEKNDLWYVDNGCTHHMTGDRTKFKGLDEGFKSHVRLGDNKQLRIEDQGRLMETGHSLLFDDEKCVVKHKVTGKIIASAYMTLNYKTCEGCMIGKQSKLAFLIGNAKKPEDVLELIRVDLCGPMRMESLSPRRKAKQKNIKILRADRGGEFVSKEFNDFCDEQGIQRLLTTPYSPEQNGVAERKNRTVVKMTRMLKQKRVFQTLFRVKVLQQLSTSSTFIQLKLFGIKHHMRLGSERNLRCNWDKKVVLVNAQDEVFTTIENKEMPAPTSTSTSPVQSSPSTPTSSATRSLMSSLTSSDNNTEIGQMKSMRLRRKEALESEEWKMAMKDELAAIQRNNALELVDLPT
ncbi:retrovirus-related pol polyprotein from transposon TNT 1-94, partial [Tanacetum coccineum]